VKIKIIYYLEKLLELFNKLKQDPRSFKIYKSLFFSVFAQVGSVVISFLLVPITLGYLDNERYGIWLILISIISWVYLLDVGLGDGLRNRLAESIALNDHSKAKGYVSTTYFFMGFLSIIILIVFFPVCYFIDWNKFLNISENISKIELLYCVLILLSFFSFHFFIKLIGTLYTALQKPYINQFLTLAISVLNLICILIIKAFIEPSLIPIAFALGISQLIVYTMFTLYSFIGPLKMLRPDYKSIKKDYFKPLFSMGVKFFIIQVSGVIMFTSANIIISKFTSPTYVVEYNLAYKYLSVSNVLFAFILLPFWSAFTDAHSQKEYLWIDKSIKKLRKLWLLTSLITIIMIVISPFFYKFWIGDKINISFIITLLTGVYFIAMNASSIYNSLLNGIGKVNFNYKLALIQVLLFYPLILLFQEIFNKITISILTTMILNMVTSSILLSLQYKKIKALRNE
jgi:O-antigen/teichoic acid export membrane protein